MINELQHPLVKDLVNRLRSNQTQAEEFKTIIAELSRLLAYNALTTPPLIQSTIDTWQGPAEYSFIKQDDLIFIPIMRAGLPMLSGLSSLFPHSPSGFLAMRRDETTHQAKTYYDRIPECNDKIVVLLDPMVATGGSLNDATTLIKSKNPSKIICLNIIGSREGLDVVESNHADVDIHIAQIDKTLDSNKFIIPGLGDAGDRAFNTPE
ncbi:uracil phosphoribosyltransferase [Thiomicrorhabdus immobilis]|uniref:Uracil phosphoribosyltransferase n=1 Tax=Thiomicrorhabdus immobilis TaxID=2791037 RepID=A0ABM7MDU0_9GAMM|nr:uracil phosphoribosyltransferase [Thiomicrorhabdus immobilis]BCN93597.1 uracil phosphoribosyltransferase [Thiomicrorhabdus immobilis]